MFIMFSMLELYVDTWDTNAYNKHAKSKCYGRVTQTRFPIKYDRMYVLGS